MTTAQHSIATLTDPVDRPQTAEQAGEVRQRLRERGWRADLAWAQVGSRSADIAVEVSGGGEVRRTIAYLPTLRSLDGGALHLWKDSDVPAPAVADVREVMLATEGVNEWISETFEAPPERIEHDHEIEAADAAV